MARAMAQVGSRNQWMTPQDLRDYQARALTGLIRHAFATVPFYRDRLSAVVQPDGSIDLDRWTDVPFLTRQQAQGNRADLESRALPASHGPVQRFSSSGTTGTPVQGKTTTLATLWSQIAQVRGREWSGIDYALNRVQIIPEIDAVDISYPGKEIMGSWAPVWAEDRTSGTWHQLDHVAPHRTQLDWLNERGRCYLWIMPNSGMRLAELVLDGAPKPDVVSIHSFGEVVTDEYRDLVRDAFGCDVWNTYASEEFGCVACQCTSGSHMHLNEDTLLVEILDEHDRPCPPGQPGELVITGLHNYQMPLIRYRTGDIGVPGEPCPCGRGFATLEQIQGRLREVFYFADGDSFIPGIQAKNPSIYLGARYYQIAQVDYDTVEIRFMSNRPEHEQDRAGFVVAMNERFERDMTCTFRQMDRLPGLDGPKFSYQVCELPPEARQRPRFKPPSGKAG